MSCVDTVLPADSLEFCPSPGATDIFVVGTYKLEEGFLSLNHETDESTSRISKPTRLGKCLLFQVEDETDRCTQLQEITIPAVLDMKWTLDLLAIADAEGHIILCRWDGENHQLDRVQSLACDTDSLCLSLDWNKFKTGQISDKIAVSLSNGSIVIAAQHSTGLNMTDTWKGHDFEPWIAAWDRWQPTFLYTGGDDCVLKGWDTRAGFDRPAFSNKRFSAGVTSIQSNPHLEHIFAVGSYDSTVKLFDNRQPSRVVNEAQVGGGAWRVKWHPDSSRRDHLLVACMHDGFKVIDFTAPFPTDSGTSQTSATISRFDGHESLAYGVDWSYTPSTKAGTLVGSCSFYDHLLQLWRA